MGVRMSLADGPPEKESIGTFFKSKAVPSHIADFQHNYILCPNTEKWFIQEDNKQVFLVPIGD
jgi:hypothetical protein